MCSHLMLDQLHVLDHILQVVNQEHLESHGLESVYERFFECCERYRSLHIRILNSLYRVCLLLFFASKISLQIVCCEKFDEFKKTINFACYFVNCSRYLPKFSKKTGQFFSISILCKFTILPWQPHIASPLNSWKYAGIGILTNYKINLVFSKNINIVF